MGERRLCRVHFVVGGIEMRLSMAMAKVMFSRLRRVIASAGAKVNAIHYLTP